MAINPTCLLQNEIPKTVGEPLFMGDDSSVPYQFYVFDSNNRTVKYFDDQIYKSKESVNSLKEDSLSTSVVVFQFV